MSGCAELAAAASDGVAPALRAVDCLAGETTAAAFGRLFGASGALAPALTILLTLYIAFFALSLLTGRSRIGVSALTPKAMTLGLVLTFATSWVAYQSVVWNLAVGAPDQIAAILTGSTGSATQIFAGRIDTVFAAIAEVATASGQSAQGAGSGAASGSFTPANILWLGALLLLVGTVGVLVTARIALAILLALGPVFVVMALFRGTRGLTAGWLRAVVLMAVTPLFVVVGGGIVMELLVPIVASLRSEAGTIDGRAAMALFLVAFVHVALMTLIGKVAATMVSAWSVFGLARAADPAASPLAAGQTGATLAAPAALVAQPAAFAPARSTALAQAAFAAPAFALPTGTGPATRIDRTVMVSAPGSSASSLPAQSVRRTRGIGSRFQPRSNHAKGMIR